MSDAVGSIQNISGDDRTVPALGGRLVLAGAVVEVPLDQVISYTQQLTVWGPYDEAAKAEHDAFLEYAAAVTAPAEDAEPPKKRAAKKATSSSTDAQEG